MEEQFVHMLSDSRSHLLLVFRHWSQAGVGVNDQGEDRGGSNTLNGPRVLLLFLEAASSSETSEFKWDIFHQAVWVEGESAGWSWGSKRRPESCCLGLIKPSGICYLTAKIMTQLGPHWFSLRADILCYFLTATWYTCDDATEIGIVRRLFTSAETMGVVLKCRRP